MGCRGEPFDVRSIRGDDRATASKRCLGDGGVDGANRVGQRPPQRAGSLGGFERERLDLTTVEQTGEIWLSATSPGLDQATRWYHREHTTLHGSGMQRPKASVVRLCSDESASVVDQSERELRCPACHQCRPTPTRSSSRSAAASSSADSAPCSRSHARTARSPRRVASHKSAASARAAETLRPSSAACCSSASNTSAGNDTERFTTDDMNPWYDHGTTTATRPDRQARDVDPDGPSGCRAAVQRGRARSVSRYPGGRQELHRTVPPG